MEGEGDFKEKKNWMFGTLVALQKMLISKEKRKKYLDCFHGWEKEQVVCY